MNVALTCQRYNGIKFTQDPKSDKVSKGLESPSPQALTELRGWNELWRSSIGKEQADEIEEVSPRLFYSGLKVNHLPPASSEQDELPSSVGLDFLAQRDDGRIYSGHLEAKRLP
ncbi:hypothetical protein Tco_1192506 [Tanacetum coccineum]